MIHYQLQCDNDHEFDGWFKDGASFDQQAATGLVACPLCNSVNVSRALMAPALGRGARHGRDVPVAEEVAAVQPALRYSGALPAIAPPAAGTPTGAEMPDKLRSILQQLRAEVEKRCDYVGTDFAEEARRIHYGERKTRGIYGETTSSEAEALADEGIEVGIMPWLRRSDS